MSLNGIPFTTLNCVILLLKVFWHNRNFWEKKCFIHTVIHKLDSLTLFEIIQIYDLIPILFHFVDKMRRSNIHTYDIQSISTKARYNKQNKQLATLTYIYIYQQKHNALIMCFTNMTVLNVCKSRGRYIRFVYIYMYIQIPQQIFEFGVFFFANAVPKCHTPDWIELIAQRFKVPNIHFIKNRIINF